MTVARRVAIIGGGPGGLYAARLLKLARPTWQVTVHERMAGSAETFGFGVGLTASTMENLTAADPVSAAEISAVSHSGHGLILQRDDDVIELHGARNLAIGRSTLLEVLGRHASDVGVELRSGQSVEATSLDADIIIASDGVRSATREKLSAELGADAHIGRGLYLWCGSDFTLDDALFLPVTTEHGTFVAHAYPYGPGRSTFLIEADEETWRAAGMDGFDVTAEGDDSDERSLAYLQAAFADALGGRPLLGNRSRWSRFYTIHLDRWWHDRTVLIGDAAHTAHYTLGSGTKLALEDAIALATALTAPNDLGTIDEVQTAFAAYEQSRRPAVIRFQRLAERSQRWWESFYHRLNQPMPTLAVGFLTRAGNLDLNRLAANDADILMQALSAYADPTAEALPLDSLPPDINQWVVRQPLDLAGATVSQRIVAHPDDLPGDVRVVNWSTADPWDEEADHIIETARADSADVLWLSGGAEQVAVQGRLDLGERLRLATGRSVAVSVPSSALPEAIAGLVAGRCDLVHISQEGES